MRAYLAECPYDSESVFVNRRGQPLTCNAVKLFMSKLADRLPFELSSHKLRHNYCTNLCYQIPTVSIKKISELLGDNEKMVIEVYNHIILDREDAQKAVEMALDA